MHSLRCFRRTPSVERMTERIYSSSYAVTDKAHSLASSCKIATWLVWICLFIIAGQIFQ